MMGLLELARRSDPFRIEQIPGESIVSFAKRLADYLVQRRRMNRVSKFTIGEWLDTLDDADLETICNSPESVPSGSKDGTLTDDLKQVCQLALAAELRSQRVRVRDHTIDELIVLASYRGLQRKGLIQVSGKLAIAPNARPPTVTILPPPTIERLLGR